ncbi:MAG: efflux RND transporter permease subunit [Candidatus Omnitrophota bacterium]
MKIMSRVLSIFSKYPKIIIGAILLITIFFAFQLRNIKTDEDMGNMFPPDHPISIYTSKVNELFGEKSKTVIVGIYNKKGIFNPGTLKKIERITEKIKGLDKVIEQEVISLTSVDNIIGVPDGLKIEPLIKSTLNDHDIENVKDKALKNELIVGNLLSRDGTASIIKASFDDDTAPQYIYSQIKKIISAEENPEKMILAGPPIADYFMTLYMKKDMMTLFPIVFLVILLILVLCFKSARGIIIPLLTVLFCVIWAMGAMAFFKIPVSMMAMMIPIIILPIGSAESIHLLRRYYLEAQQTDDKHTAISTTMRELQRPILFASLTTQAGFASLATSSLPWVKYFGLFAAAGSLSSLILTLFFTPACLYLLNLPKSKKAGPKQLGMLEKGMEKFGNFAFTHHIPITVITVIVIAISIIGTFKVTIGHNPINYISKDSEINRAVQFINKNFNGGFLLNLVIEATDENGIKDPKLLNTMLKSQKFATNTRVDNNVVVGGTLSIADYIKRINAAVNENNPQYFKIPAQKNIISDYILLYSLSGNPDSLYKLIDSRAKTANIQLILKTEDSAVLKKLIRKLNVFISKNFDKKKVSVNFAGPAFKTAAAMELIISGQLSGLVVAVLVILGFCIMEFRSFIGGLIAIIGVTITILINYGILGLFHIPLTMPIVVMSALVLGIDVDFSTYFIEEYMNSYHASIKNNPGSAPLKQITVKTMIVTGVPILITSITLFLGFGVLLLSAFPPIAILGILVAFTMFSGFLGSTLMLSSLLNIIKPKFIRRQLP